MNTVGNKGLQESPGWPVFDEAVLTGLGAPASAVAALTGRGLPVEAPASFVRDGGRELSRADLPGCGVVLFLGRSQDGVDTYWLSLADGSVWAGQSKASDPIDDTHRINTSVAAFQDILAAVSDFEDAGLEEDDKGYEDLVCATIVRAVSADPVVFEEENGKWPVFFEELEYTITSILAGEQALYQLVRQDESGAWVLDHPGYDEDDEDDEEEEKEKDGEG